MPTEYSADLFFKNGPDRGIRVRRDRGRLASRGSTLHGMTTTAISHRSAREPIARLRAYLVAQKAWGKTVTAMVVRV